MRIIAKILILFLLFAPIVSVEASGIKVNPPKLEISVRTDEPAIQEITIANPTSDVQVFKVYPDDFTDIIRANPLSFILEAGAEKKVVITVRSKDDLNTSAVLNTNISIVAKPLAETGFQTNAGVKIPISVTVLENNFSDRVSKQGYYAMAIIFLIGVGIGSYAYHVRRKNKLSAQ